MRNSQPRPHPPLRLLPQQRGDGDVLDPIAPGGHDALDRRRAIGFPTGPVPTAAGFAFLLHPPPSVPT